MNRDLNHKKEPKMKATIAYFNNEDDLVEVSTQDKNELADMVEILVRNEAVFNVDLHGASINADGSIDDSSYVRIPC